MERRPVGIAALAVACLSAGLTGIMAAWAAWPRSSQTSPLAAISASVWSSANLAAALLIWRRSPRAPQFFVVAMALLLGPAYFLFPGGYLPILLTSAMVILLAGVGYRYVNAAVEVVP